MANIDEIEGQYTGNISMGAGPLADQPHIKVGSGPLSSNSIYPTFNNDANISRQELNYQSVTEIVAKITEHKCELLRYAISEHKFDDFINLYYSIPSRLTYEQTFNCLILACSIKNRPVTSFIAQHIDRVGLNCFNTLLSHALHGKQWLEFNQTKLFKMAGFLFEVVEDVDWRVELEHRFSNACQIRSDDAVLLVEYLPSCLGRFFEIACQSCNMHVAILIANCCSEEGKQNNQLDDLRIKYAMEYTHDPDIKHWIADRWPALFPEWHAKLSIKSVPKLRIDQQYTKSDNKSRCIVL